MEDIGDYELISEDGVARLLKSQSTEIDKLLDATLDETRLHVSDESSIGLEMAEAFENADFDLAYELWVRRCIRSSWSTVYQPDEGSGAN